MCEVFLMLQCFHARLGQVPQRTAVGPLRAHPCNPRCFTDGTANADCSLRAVYLTGSHTWNSLQDVTGKEWFMPSLISTQGFNSMKDRPMKLVGVRGRFS
jgi:hypothetical protein